MVDGDRFGRFGNRSHAMSKEQRGNKESKKGATAINLSRILARARVPCARRWKEAADGTHLATDRLITAAMIVPAGRATGRSFVLLGFRLRLDRRALRGARPLPGY